MNFLFLFMENEEQDEEGLLEILKNQKNLKISWTSPNKKEMMVF